MRTRTALLAALMALLMVVAGCGTRTGPTGDERAAEDGGTPVPSPSASTALPVPGAIPAGFPIAWDAIDMTDDGGELLGPGPRAPGVLEVSPCEQAVWPVAGDERLAFRTTGPEFEESRELVVLASAEEAVTAMAGVRSALADCPTEINELDPTSSQEQAWDLLEARTGYEDSVTFSMTYTDGMPGGQIWQLTRVGRAIIAVGTGGEYSRGRSTRFAARRLTGLTAHLTPRMCAFTEAGC